VAIDRDGRLLSAYSDYCKNYKPIKSKPTKVESVKDGTIYECKNLQGRGCSSCKKLTDRTGKLTNN